MHYRIGAFAARAGVTVRTVRYYDRLGLLRPSGRSEAGQRLYTDRDFVRLQQILTLKLIGLSLEEIGRLLAQEAGDLAGLLERQKRMLEAQAKAVLRLSETIGRAQALLGQSPTTDLEQFIKLIQVVMMHEEKPWLSQFLSESQQATMAAAATIQPLEAQRDHGVALQQLFEAIAPHLDDDPRDPAVQALVERWDALLGDDAAAAGMLAAYAAYDTLPGLDDAPELRAWALRVRDCAAFIERARG